MDIISRIIWWVKLDYPVNPRDIKTTSGYVSADKYARLCIDEFKKCVGPFLLLLIALGCS